jgi:hypothetical protein
MVSGASGCGSNTNFAVPPRAAGGAPMLGLTGGLAGLLPGAIADGAMGASVGAG